jgi:hypothetical protein
LATRAATRKRRRRNAQQARKALRAATPPPRGLVAAAEEAVALQADQRERARPRKLHVDTVGMLLLDDQILPEQASALATLHADAVAACMMQRVIALYERRSMSDGEVMSPRALDARRRFRCAMLAIPTQEQRDAVQYVALWPNEAPTDGGMLQDLRDGAGALELHYDRSAEAAYLRRMREQREQEGQKERG